MTQFARGPMLALGVLALATLPAAAALEDSTTYHPDGNPINIGAADMPDVAINKFDTSKGTLNDIVITLTTIDTLQSLVINLGSGTSYLANSAAATFNVSGQDGLGTSSSLSVNSLSGFIGAGSFSNPQIITSAEQAQGLQSQVHVPLSEFGNFESLGGGILDYALTASLSQVTPPQSSLLPLLQYGFNATSDISLTVDYYYTPLTVIPEGGTAMAGCFALGIGFLTVLRPRLARP